MAGYAELRARLENDLLGQLEPGAYHFIPVQRNADRIVKPTLMLKLSSLTRSTAAQGVLVPSFVLTVVSEYTEPAEADIALDNHLDTLLAAIQPIRWVAFRSAEKAMFQTRWMCYDIQLEALTAIKKGA